MTAFISSLYQTGKQVSRVLEEILSEQNVNIRLQSATSDGVLNGGKRIRPFLVVETARLFGVTDPRVFRVAAALECIHCCSLIHDDLPAMDDSDMRRGKPTIHKRYDEATAILAGDVLLLLAFEILSDSRTTSDLETRLSLINLLSKASGLNGMMAGQMIDLESERSKDSLDIAGVKKLQDLKTGKLIQVAVEMGATLGGANTTKLSALRNYSKNIGLAFQVYDDLLDCLGTTELTGKCVGKDVNKATFVSLLGIDGAKSYACELVLEAKEAISIFGEDGKMLIALADFIIDREY